VRVLFTDDERLLAETIAEGLRKLAMAVDVCHDGQAALDRLSVNHYDVAVIDRDMPVRTGDAVCRWMVRARVRVEAELKPVEVPPVCELSQARCATGCVEPGPASGAVVRSAFGGWAGLGSFARHSFSGRRRRPLGSAVGAW
jgi:hypothetical protein